MMTDEEFGRHLTAGDEAAVAEAVRHDPTRATRNLDPDGGDAGWPLRIASEQGSLAVVEALLAAGARVDRPPQYDHVSCLQAAVMSRHFKIAHRLLDAGAAVDTHPNADQSAIQRLFTHAVDDGGVPEALVRRGMRRCLDKVPPPPDITDQPASVRLLSRMIEAGGEVAFASVIRHQHIGVLEDMFRQKPRESDHCWSLSAWYGYPELLDLFRRTAPDHINDDSPIYSIEAAVVSHNRDGSPADYLRLIRGELEQLRRSGRLNAYIESHMMVHRTVTDYAWPRNYGYRADIFAASDVVDLIDLFEEFGFSTTRIDATSGRTPLEEAHHRKETVPVWDEVIERLSP